MIGERRAPVNDVAGVDRRRRGRRDAVSESVHHARAFDAGPHRGQITMAFSDVTAALPYVEQKKVRAIAVAGEQRNPVLPGVGTFPEQGYPDIQMTAWSAILAPRGTPPAVLEKLSAAIRRANAADAAVELRRRSGSNDLWMPLPEARRFLAAEIARWERYVRDSGVRPE